MHFFCGRAPERLSETSRVRTDERKPNRFSPKFRWSVTAQAAARGPRAFDLYANFNKGVRGDDVLAFARGRFDRVFSRRQTDNVGLDMRGFVEQAAAARTPSGDYYDVVLKLHTKSDGVWRALLLDSLRAARKPSVARVTWIRGNGSRRRRGRDVDSPRRRVAAPPRLRRKRSAETSRNAAAAATWIVRGDGPSLIGDRVAAAAAAPDADVPMGGRGAAAAIRRARSRRRRSQFEGRGRGGRGTYAERTDGTAQALRLAEPGPRGAQLVARQPAARPGHGRGPRVWPDDAQGARVAARATSVRNSGPAARRVRRRDRRGDAAVRRDARRRRFRRRRPRDRRRVHVLGGPRAARGPVRHRLSRCVRERACASPKFWRKFESGLLRPATA